MSTLAALAAGAMVTCALLAIPRDSIVERRLAAFTGGVRPVRLATRVRTELGTRRAVGALGAAFIACGVSAILGLGILPVPIAAYAGLVVPSLIDEARQRRRRRAADRATVTLVEWLHALVSAGQPLESAVARLGARGSGSPLLDAALDDVRRDYALGVPMHLALAERGRSAGIDGLIEIARRIERSRELGRGVLPLLHDLRDELRAAERARALRSASHVDGKLTAVLTVCYLPALALLVIVPLFLTLLAGLFG